MSETDLRRLDGWIAEHVFGKTVCPGEYDHILTDDNTVLLAPAYSSDPAAFALVKREMERRGWDWMCERATINVLPFLFSVFTEVVPRTSDIYHGEASSEELAGCLAVKAAVEASSSSIPA